MDRRFYLEEAARLEHSGREALAARAQMALQHEVEEQRVVQADLSQHRRSLRFEETQRYQVVDREDRHHAGQRVLGTVEKARMPCLLLEDAHERGPGAVALRHR